MSLKGELLTILQNKERTLVRVGTNADYTPGGDFDIFTIAGGPIAVTGLFGHVRVACTGAALVPLLSYYPAITGIGAISAIATVAVGAAHVVDTILVWDGLLASVLAPSVGLGHGQSGPVESFDGGYIVMLPGIFLVVNATADATAEIDWYLTYKPLRDTVNVAVA